MKRVLFTCSVLMCTACIVIAFLTWVVAFDDKRSAPRAMSLTSQPRPAPEATLQSP